MYILFCLDSGIGEEVPDFIPGELDKHQRELYRRIQQRKEVSASKVCIWGIPWFYPMCCSAIMWTGRTKNITKENRCFLRFKCF